MEPKTAADYNNLGVVFQGLGKTAKAIANYNKALEINPKYAKAYANLATLFQNQNKSEKAVKFYKQALEIDPGNIKTYRDLGLLLISMGKTEEAQTCFEKAIKIKPDYEEAYANLVYLLYNQCDWKGAKKQSEKLDQLTEKSLSEGRKCGQSPYIDIFRCDNPKHNLEVARNWSRNIQLTALANTQPFFHHPSNHTAKLRIGYLSNNYNNHPVGHLVAGLFGLHDRKHFEIFGYSYGIDDQSNYREKISKDCDIFTDLTKLNGIIEAARKIYADKIDILIDLVGYTTNAKLGICALRPAPVQVTWLGFPGTSGADFFDYVIVDPIVAPKEHIKYYSEKLIYMSDCYQVNDFNQRISGKRFKRADFNLPEKAFVFAAFVQPIKIEPVMFTVWMKILSAVPGSVLWLWKQNQQQEDNLKREAKKRGVDPNRLIFAGKLPKAEHLARLKLADLGLDTRIYNGHVTTSDALWAGVPVVSLLGKHFASRVSASLLTAVGLPELITHSLKEYEDLAIELALNPKKLSRIYKSLIINRKSSSLFDTKTFVKDLEIGYKKIWSIYLNGEKPKQIEIKC